MSERHSFFAELKRRNVYKVAVAYAVVGWLLIQVATQVFPFFEIPNWAVRLVVLASWLDSHRARHRLGVRTDAGRNQAHGRCRSDARKDSRETSRLDLCRDRWRGASIGLFLSVVTRPRNTASVGLRTESGYRFDPIPQKSIAVLPFENLSDDKSNAYFAEGIQDEILTRLAEDRRPEGDLAHFDCRNTRASRTICAKSRSSSASPHSRRQRAESRQQGARQRAAHSCRDRFASLGRNLRPRNQGCLCRRERSGQEIAESLQAKLSPAEANTLATAKPRRTPQPTILSAGRSPLSHTRLRLRYLPKRAAIS